MRGPHTGRHRTVSRKRQAIMLGWHKGVSQDGLHGGTSHRLVRGGGAAQPLSPDHFLLGTDPCYLRSHHLATQEANRQGLKWQMVGGSHLAQAGCQLREKAALEGLRRCPGLCPHVLPKPCLEVPRGEGKAQSHWSPSSSENDIRSWVRKVQAMEHHPPAQECTSLPTAVQITTTWGTGSNRSLSSYISGPKHPDQGVRTPSRSSRGGPSRLSQLLGVQEPLGLWSHPPNLCSVVTQPLPSRLTRMMPVGFGGTQVIQDNLI